MSVYTKEEMAGCECCIFKSDDVDFCDFEGRRLVKPGPVKSLWDCPFYIRDSHYARMSKDEAAERKADSIKRASKYLIDIDKE